ncbi:MAG: ABC transporter substrate-binding protein [Betaproteobacteria bacterium]
MISVAQQQPAKIPRIGYVSETGNSANPGPYVEAMRQGLRDLGYVEGKNIVIEYRGAEGESGRIAGLVAELVQFDVDVLVVPTPTAVRVAKQATKMIPIVMVTSIDPVATGIVESLARPGGNITGLFTLNEDLSGIRLELLKKMVPGLALVGVLRDADMPTSAPYLKEYEVAAAAQKIQLLRLNMRGPKPDYEGAFRDATKARVSAVITVTSPQLFYDRERIVGLAMKNQLPTMSQGSAWVEAGGLMSYSVNDLEVFRRTAYYVDRILKGAKPAELPVEQPTKFELVVNKKAAKLLGLTIPAELLLRADRLIQ